MKNTLGYILIFSLLLTACGPNYNYRVQVPAGWSVVDTVMQGTKVRIVGPMGLALDGHPVANIIVQPMGGKDLFYFTESNMHYLQQEDGISLVDKGGMFIGDLPARWFSYNEVYNGATRELIVYIIPVNRYAYMLTCGADSGYRAQYQPMFDSIASSFKLR